MNDELWGPVAVLLIFAFGPFIVRIVAGLLMLAESGLKIDFGGQE